MVTNPSKQTQTNEYLSGRQLSLARLAWVLFALVLTFIWAAGQVAAFREVQQLQLPPEAIARLTQMGLSVQRYGIINVSYQWLIPLAWGGLALLIFWQKANERNALIISAMMVGLAMSSSIMVFKSFVGAHQSWAWLALLAAFIGNMCMFSFFFVFPTGRYVPRWTVAVAVVLSAFNILNAYDFALPPPLVALGKSLDWLFSIFFVASVASLMLAPVYRYRRVSTPIERAQIKWVVFTVVMAVLVFALSASTVFFLPNSVPGKDFTVVTVFIQPLGWTLGFVFIPIVIAIAILRYRLWDIDVIIRKTLVYSVLTALLALFFFGVVGLLQAVFGRVTGVEQSPLAVVISTLAIAALFTPLRRRIQDAIDRRFFRQKYNAQQVLAQFTQTARDETDLDALTGELARVAQETMQPEYVNVWLNHSGDGKGRRK